MVEAGVHWLVTHQSPVGGWGETLDANATVAHTAMALQTMAECNADLGVTRVSSAFDWLASTIADVPPNEIHAYVETYNITSSPGLPARQWRETMHHYGLALAATALLRNPCQLPGHVLRRAYATLFDTQLPGGEWAGERESPVPLLWPTCG
jgi:hypothetical protein